MQGQLIQQRMWYVTTTVSVISGSSSLSKYFVLVVKQNRSGEQQGSITPACYLGDEDRSPLSKLAANNK